MLAEAESRSRRTQVRRRMVVLGAPSLVVTLTSTIALSGAQSARAALADERGIQLIAIHALTIVYAVAFVALPMLGAARTRRWFPSVLALVAGPISTPSLFGSGGWRPMETVVLAVIAFLISAGALQRRGARGLRPAAT